MTTSVDNDDDIRAMRPACRAGEFAVMVRNTVFFCTVNSESDHDADAIVKELNRPRRPREQER